VICCCEATRAVVNYAAKITMKINGLRPLSLVSITVVCGLALTGCPGPKEDPPTTSEQKLQEARKPWTYRPIVPQLVPSANGDMTGDFGPGHETGENRPCTMIITITDAKGPVKWLTPASATQVLSFADATEKSVRFIGASTATSFRVTSIVIPNGADESYATTKAITVSEGKK
jgi:hypothetical protein